MSVRQQRLLPQCFSIDWLAILVSVGLSALVTIAAFYQWHHDRQISEVRARTVAQQVSSALEIMAADRHRALLDLTGHWPVSHANPIDWFNVRALTLQKMLPGISDLLYLDAAGRLLWSTDATMRKQLGKHINELWGVQLQAGELILLYPPGQPKQLMVVRPIAAQEQRLGAVAMVFEISTILSVYTADLASGGFSYQVIDDGSVLEQAGQISAELPLIRQPVEFAGRHWVFVVQDQTNVMHWPLSFAVSGWALSIFVGWLYARQRARERQAQRYQQLYYSAADAALDAMLMFEQQPLAKDANPIDFSLGQCNRVAYQLLGTELLQSGQRLSLLCQQVQQGAFFSICLKVAQSGQPFERVVPNQSPLLLAKWLRIQVVKSNQGLAITLRDVSQEQQLIEQIRYQAEHDPLTGLFNRFAFEKRLSQSLRQQKAGALCYIDMDQFKQINDSCGHLAGDALLKQVAGLLSTDIAGAQMLARVGGDEFCLLLNDTSAAQVEGRLRALLKRISTFRFHWQQQVFSIGASIGVVDLQRFAGNSQELLKAADNGCYLAKHAGRNRYCWVEPDMPALNHLQQQRQLANYLRLALEQQLFELYAQPIVPLSVPTRGLQYEILLRLHDEQGAPLSPAMFIPLAEQMGLMGQIDRYVIRQVLLQLAQHPLHMQQLDKVAINLSGASLSDPELLSFITEQLQRSQVDAEKICFEITETAAITNLAAARQLISQLRQLGCRFALDDFGAGMSSFAYLRDLQVDLLKIDGSFVKHMTQQSTDAVMVRAMAEIARSFQMETIAEFVPDEATCVLLRSFGVHYGQGYGLGKPKPWHDYLQRAAA